jgi:hypothetical protein
MANSNLYFFGERASFSNPQEESEAREYLELWKKFTLKNLKRDCYEAELVDQQYITRDPMYSGALCITTTLALKLCVRIKFRFECDWPHDGICREDN